METKQQILELLMDHPQTIHTLESKTSVPKHVCHYLIPLLGSSNFHNLNDWNYWLIDTAGNPIDCWRVCGTKNDRNAAISDSNEHKFKRGTISGLYRITNDYETATSLQNKAQIQYIEFSNSIKNSSAKSKEIEAIDTANDFEKEEEEIDLIGKKTSLK